MRRLAAAALAIALAGCAASPQQRAQQGPKKATWQAPVVTLAGDEITYRGDFIFDSGQRVLAVAGAHRVRSLRIWSGGGEVGGAIDTALWLHRNGIDVIVDGPCLSSCANYIFPAGREKYIVGEGYVAWHGNLQHRLYQDARGLPKLEGNRALFESVAAKERAFYAETGLNGYIAWFGKIAPYDTWGFYFLSQQDMEYFGLAGLHVRSDYLATDHRREKRNLRLLTVDRAVTNPDDPNWLRWPERK